MATRARLLVLTSAMLAGAGAGLLVVALRAGGQPPIRVAPAPPSTRPVAADGEEYPPAKLRAACDAAAERLREKLDDTFTVVVSPPFVVAGNSAPARVRAYAQHSVIRPAEALWRGYMDAKPTDVITALLFKDAATYKHWAKALYGDTDLPHYGYCRGDGVMVMNIATGTGTLVHELTHALIAYDFPTVPMWFNEGFACLHEQCTVERETIIGHTNWRLPGLQQALRAGKLRPLRDLVTKRDFYGDLRGINYAQARYFVLYMQRQGLLKRFYTHFRDLHAEAANRRAEELRPAANVRAADAAEEASLDIAAIEFIFGRKIDDIDAALREWIPTLRFP